MLLALAHGSCPDPAALLRNIEADTVDQFLADAQRGIIDVIDALGCSKPVSAEIRRRLFLAQAHIWAYGAIEEEDPRVARALASAWSSDPTKWGHAFPAEGPEHELWSALELNEDDPMPVEIRNLAENESIWLDGTPSFRPVWVTPGLHILQVGMPGAMRHARLLDATGPTIVTLPRVEAKPVADPEPKPVAEAEPKPVAPPQPELVAKPVPRPEPLPVPAAAVPAPAPSPTAESTARIIPVADPNVMLPLPDIDGGTLCAQDPKSRKCRPLRGRAWHLQVDQGLAPVEVIWRNGTETQSFVSLFWLDESPPKAPRLGVVPRQDVIEIVPWGDSEPESWIVDHLLSDRDDCSTILESSPGGFRISWEEFRKERYVCSRNATGGISDGVKVTIDSKVTRPGTPDLQPSTELAAGGVVVTLPEDLGPHCTSKKVGCKKLGSGEAYRDDKPPPGFLLLHHHFEIGSAASAFLVDVMPPRDGKVVITDMGSVAVSMEGFTDEASGIRGYQLELGDEPPGATCAGATLTVEHPWALVPATSVRRWLRVCAVDAAGRVSPGVKVKLR